MAALISIVIVVLNTIAAILVVWGKTYDEGERLTPRGRWAVFCILVAAAIQIQRSRGQHRWSMMLMRASPLAYATSPMISSSNIPLETPGKILSELLETAGLIADGLPGEPQEP